MDSDKHDAAPAILGLGSPHSDMSNPSKTINPEEILGEPQEHTAFENDHLTENKFQDLDSVISKFARMLSCFHYPVPTDLFIHAVRQKPTWSSDGEPTWIDPGEFGIPIWLRRVVGLCCDFDLAVNGQKWGSMLLDAGVRVVSNAGVQHLQLASSTADVISRLVSPEERRELLKNCVTITIHAFPCQYLEICGQEVAFRLSPLLQSFILPFLALLTDDDLVTWISPFEESKRGPFLTRFIEFLYNGSVALGFRHGAIPRTLSRNLLLLILQDDSISPSTRNYCITLVTVGELMRNSITVDSLNKESISLVRLPSAVDKRSNAAYGMGLALLGSQRTNVGKQEQLMKEVIENQKRWNNFSPNISSMEIIASSTFSISVAPHQYEPHYRSQSLEVQVMLGFNLARRGHVSIAAEILADQVSQIASKYGSSSLEYGVSVAELANCYNRLRKEDLGYNCTTKALINRSTGIFRNRSDWAYLALARADSLIGRSMYEEASEQLKDILSLRAASESTIMSTILRYSKVQRRLGKEGKHNLQKAGLLFRGASLYRNASLGQQVEYIDELACNLSLIEADDLKSTPGLAKLLGNLRATFDGSKGPSKEVAASQGFLQMEERYKNLVKESDLRAIRSDTGLPKTDHQTGNISFADNFEGGSSDPQNLQIPDIDLPQPQEAFDDPWTKKAALIFDSGGLRSYGSLLILQYLMDEIRYIETSWDLEGGPHSSSFCPLAIADEDNHDGNDDNNDRALPLAHKDNGTDENDENLITILRHSWRGFYPCHYFDYISGSECGGFLAILLGRLRMTVDQCIAAQKYLMKKVFSRARAQVYGWPFARYDRDSLRAAIHDIMLGRVGAKPGFVPFACSEDICQTFVIGSMVDEDSAKEQIQIFRTYNNDLNPTQSFSRYQLIHPGPADTIPIERLLSLTFANDCYFVPEQFYDERGLKYCGMAACRSSPNPTVKASSEILFKEHSKGKMTRSNSAGQKQDVLEIVLNIGAGGRLDRWQAKQQAPQIQGDSKLFTQLQQLALVELQGIDVFLGESVYYRWGGGEDLWSIPWDLEGKTARDVERAAADYMADEKKRNEVRNVARLLVQRRRRRCADLDKWYRFSNDPPT